VRRLIFTAAIGALTVLAASPAGAADDGPVQGQNARTSASPAAALKLFVPDQAIETADPRTTLAAAPAVKEGEAKGDEATELAKKTQNPVAAMISVPFQFNTYFGAGKDKDKTIYSLNIQPVIPSKLNDDWNLITRIIVPLNWQPSLYPGMGSASGMGDINPSLFFSPSKPGKVIWGVGPTFIFPTATDRLLGSGKYSAGPTGVILAMDGPWVYGVLANNQWSYAPRGDQRVNQMLINPFLAYNLPNAWSLSTSPNITADWTAPSDQRWTVPVGGGVARVFFIGKLPVKLSLSAYYNVKHPDGAPQWFVQTQFSLLFPAWK